MGATNAIFMATARAWIIVMRGTISPARVGRAGRIDFLPTLHAPHLVRAGGDGLSTI